MNLNEMETESLNILFSVAHLAQEKGLLSLDDAAVVSKAIQNLDNINIELEPTDKKWRKYLINGEFYKYCACNAVVLILKGKEYVKPDKEELEHFQAELDNKLNCNCLND